MSISQILSCSQLFSSRVLRPASPLARALLRHRPPHRVEFRHVHDVVRRSLLGRALRRCYAQRRLIPTGCCVRLPVRRIMQVQRSDRSCWSNGPMLPVRSRSCGAVVGYPPQARARLSNSNLRVSTPLDVAGSLPLLVWKPRKFAGRLETQEE